MIAKDLFRVLKEKCGRNLNSFISQKVVVVPGDIACENLGVKDTDLLKEMWKEVDVVVNLAATTNFDERYIWASKLLISCLNYREMPSAQKICTGSMKDSFQMGFA